MNLQQLKAICGVADHGLNVSAASRALGVSQPAISKQIAAFEAEMQTPIFVRRGGRFFALTPVGHQIVVAARDALARLTEIRSLCTPEGKVGGHLRIAASRSSARNILPGVLQIFSQRHPGVQISIRHGNLAEMIGLLTKGDVSLAVTIENRIDDTKIATISLRTIQRIIVVPKKHALLRSKVVDLHALRAFPLILYDVDYSFRQEVLDAFASVGLTPDIAMNVSESEVIKAHVACGLGIGLVAESAFDPRSDTKLAAIPAGHLFRSAELRLLIPRQHFLKRFEEDFIRLCSPNCSRSELQRLLTRAVPEPQNR